MGRLAESCKTNEDSHHELMRLGIASFNLSSVQILEKLPNKSRQNNERQRSSRQVQGGAVQFLLGLKTHLPIDYRYIPIKPSYCTNLAKYEAPPCVDFVEIVLQTHVFLLLRLLKTATHGDFYRESWWVAAHFMLYLYMQYMYDCGWIIG